MSNPGLPPQVGSSSPKTFEFTKRKRWADLLATELTEGINFVLSPTSTVLYCGPAVTELIGWRDTDLIDRDLLEIITSDDQAAFRASFEESIRENSELLTYTRLKCSESLPSYSTDTKDMLFEVKGHPHLLETEVKCFFASAKPYPSKNTEMLNTFLDLKTENEQLQRRLLELRNRLPPQSFPPPLTVAPNEIYATSPIQFQRGPSAPAVLPRRSAEPSSLYYPSETGAFENMLSSSVENSLYDDRSAFGPPIPGPSNADEEGEEGTKKKKPKKTHLAEQYVCITCGRTDSPEWRKGPLGPKTLCNACGLRWAKQVRKFDDPAGEGRGESAAA